LNSQFVPANHEARQRIHADRDGGPEQGLCNNNGQPEPLIIQEQRSFTVGVAREVFEQR